MPAPPPLQTIGPHQHAQPPAGARPHASTQTPHPCGETRRRERPQPDHEQLAFAPEHAGGLPDHLGRLGGTVEYVHQQHHVGAGTRQRQRFRPCVNSGRRVPAIDRNHRAEPARVEAEMRRGADLNGDRSGQIRKERTQYRRIGAQLRFGPYTDRGHHPATRFTSPHCSPCRRRFRVNMPAMDVVALRAFRDNYIWTLHSGTDAVVVDPGDAAPVQAWLAETGSRLVAILLTHHHRDHVGGAVVLKARHRARVFGPAGEDIAGVDVAVADGDIARPGPGFPDFEVLEVPGHTAGHIAYFGDDLLFCGDTLFSAGCGRLFEGTAEQLHRSLSRLAALPATTRVYAGHEYTAANLRFARAVLPAEAGLEEALANASKITENGDATLPSTIGRERAFNVFLRCDETAVRRAAEQHTGAALGTAVEVFAALRRWKDGF